MNSRHIFTALLLAGLTSAAVTGALAERVKEGGAKANAAFDRCEGAGSATVDHGDGVTSCIHNGHGIVCGGTSDAVKAHPDLKGTCDTFIRSPKFGKRQTAIERSRMKKMAMAPAAH